MRMGRGPGSPDDIEALFGEQTAHFLSEARVVVDDQATQLHKACTIAGTAAQNMGASAPERTTRQPPCGQREAKGWTLAAAAIGRWPCRQGESWRRRFLPHEIARVNRF
jgi:hypothetical protein